MNQVLENEMQQQVNNNLRLQSCEWHLRDIGCFGGQSVQIPGSKGSSHDCTRPDNLHL